MGFESHLMYYDLISLHLSVRFRKILKNLNYYLLRCIFCHLFWLKNVSRKKYNIFLQNVCDNFYIDDKFIHPNSIHLIDYAPSIRDIYIITILCWSILNVMLILRLVYGIIENSSEPIDCVHYFL